MVRHGATYAGHPTCCAAAMANLDLLESEQLIPRGRELEGALWERSPRWPTIPPAATCAAASA